MPLMEDQHVPARSLLSLRLTEVPGARPGPLPGSLSESEPYSDGLYYRLNGAAAATGPAPATAAGFRIKVSSQYPPPGPLAGPGPRSRWRQPRPGGEARRRAAE